MIDDDNERMKFLDRLSRSNCSLTELEAKFVDDILESEQGFGESARRRIDRMREHYEPYLKAQRG